MGAWIEILSFSMLSYYHRVAPHDGCVDWNLTFKSVTLIRPCRTPRWVRGLKSNDYYPYNEGTLSHPTMGAWIEISVSLYSRTFLSSHPTMGAWIEINNLSLSMGLKSVAPHDGCVDWNNNFFVIFKINKMSHPTMGAWIEIQEMERWNRYASSRTPRWVRGLKLDSFDSVLIALSSHPTMGAWIEIISVILLYLA